MVFNKKAFTLVELIVVITILSILGTIAFISLQGYSKSARDSARMSDISNIKTGLELFHLNAGKYPMPDKGEEVTYSGGIVWTQGIVGDIVIGNLDKLSKKPLDPLTEREYIYSVLNSKQEYEIGTILEGESITLNIWLKDTYATELQKVNAHITGNYNGLIAKVLTGSTTYVLSVPSIISTEIGDLLDLITNKKLSYDGYSNLWNTYTGTKFDINGETELTLTNQLLLYSGAIEDLRVETNQISLIKNIQNAFSGTVLSNVSQINNILEADIVGDQEGTIILAQILIKNTIDSNIQVNYNKNNNDNIIPVVDFVSTWDTTKTGGETGSNQIKLPLILDGTYDFIVDWGDGFNDNITSYNQAEITHTYTVGGVYDISISGDISGFSFSNSGDKTKIIEIKSWGPLMLGNNNSHFRGCVNLINISATDLPNLNGITDLSQMFANTTNLSNITNINLWDISGVNNMYMMFSGAALFNQDISGWDVSNVTNMSGMFWFASNFDQDISGWDVNNVIDYFAFDESTSANWESIEKPSFP